MSGNGELLRWEPDKNTQRWETFLKIIIGCQEECIITDIDLTL